MSLSALFEKNTTTFCRSIQHYDKLSGDLLYRLQCNSFRFFAIFARIEMALLLAGVYPRLKTAKWIDDVEKRSLSDRKRGTVSAFECNSRRRGFSTRKYRRARSGFQTGAVRETRWGLSLMSRAEVSGRRRVMSALQCSTTHGAFCEKWKPSARALSRRKIDAPAWNERNSSRHLARHARLYAHRV